MAHSALHSCPHAMLLHALPVAGECMLTAAEPPRFPSVVIALQISTILYRTLGIVSKSKRTASGRTDSGLCLRYALPTSLTAVSLASGASAAATKHIITSDQRDRERESMHIVDLQWLLSNN